MMCMVGRMELSYFKTNSVSVNQDQDIIDFVRMQGGIVTENEILNAFHYMPKDYVVRCVVRNNRTLISCGRGYRFHIDNYRINDIEKNGIREIIQLSIQSTGYLTTSELARMFKSNILQYCQIILSMELLVFAMSFQICMRGNSRFITT